ncbi:MAG: inositol monophosphatase family protein [Gemmatimonadaceae bacterium]
MTSSEGTKGERGGQAAGGGRAADAAFLEWLLEDMRGAAFQAARLIQGRARDLGTLIWESKSPADYVSEVDTSAEALIRSLLEGDALGPWDVAARVVGEELSPDAELTGGADVVFVVDPLDGTTNFLHGYPWYAVSIGALVDGVLAAGVVVNAATGETFTATSGGGAFRDGQPIRVSTNADPSRALVGTGFPFKNLDQLELYQRQFAAVTRRTAGVRRAGAAALDLCDVACGRFDAFWELRLAPWDVAAGILVIREAGGVVTELGGAEARVGPGPIVAGSPAMHPWLLETLRA